jgi:hypothetical protein
MFKRSQPENSAVRRRAADIRRHWTLRERMKRLGLPPDMPERLQSYLVGRPERNW